MSEVLKTLWLGVLVVRKPLRDRPDRMNSVFQADLN